MRRISTRHPPRNFGWSRVYSGQPPQSARWLDIPERQHPMAGIRISSRSPDRPPMLPRDVGGPVPCNICNVVSPGLLCSRSSAPFIMPTTVWRSTALNDRRLPCRRQLARRVRQPVRAAGRPARRAKIVARKSVCHPRSSFRWSAGCRPSGVFGRVGVLCPQVRPEHFVVNPFA